MRISALNMDPSERWSNVQIDVVIKIQLNIFFILSLVCLHGRFSYYIPTEGDCLHLCHKSHKSVARFACPVFIVLCLNLVLLRFKVLCLNLANNQLSYQHTAGDHYGESRVKSVNIVLLILFIVLIILSMVFIIFPTIFIILSIRS